MANSLFIRRAGKTGLGLHGLSAMLAFVAIGAFVYSRAPQGAALTPTFASVTTTSASFLSSTGIATGTVTGIIPSGQPTNLQTAAFNPNANNNADAVFTFPNGPPSMTASNGGAVELLSPIHNVTLGPLLTVPFGVREKLAAGVKKAPNVPGLGDNLRRMSSAPH
jgi:hypothetical protein